MKPVVQKLWMFITMVCTSISLYAYDFIVDGIAYNVTSFSDLTCEVANGVSYEGQIVIPSEVSYNGKKLKVTAINSACFRRCNNLESIILPNTIHHLGSYCFYECGSLEKITLPDSLISIGRISDGSLLYGCFNGCTSLKQIDLPSTVTSIGAYTFASCSSLASVTLPEKLEEIGKGCFYNCDSLTSLVPNSLTVKDWPGELFKYCPNIESVIIPEGVESLGEDCFLGCDQLRRITLPSTLTSLGQSCFEGTAISNIDLKNITQIRSGLFKNCKNLHELEIPESVESIEIAALKRIDIVRILTFENVPLKKLTIKGNATSEPLIVGAEIGGNLINPYNNGLLGIRTTWCQNLRDLKLQRPISLTRFFCPLLETMDLDFEVEDMDSISINKIAELSELSCLKLSAQDPPKVSSGTFSNHQYMHLCVTVPSNAIEKYRNADIWKNFWNIISDEAGVDKVMSGEKAEIARYDLLGNPVTSNYHGVIIIQYSDGTFKKCLITQ